VTPAEQLAETLRYEGRHVLATLVRVVGDLQVAEDAVQEASIAALRTWTEDTMPDNPRAWLTVTARHKAYDALRRESVRPTKEKAADWGNHVHTPDPIEGVHEMAEQEIGVHDDLLRLVFTCCHPALGMDARVALALRTLAGLEVKEIARAFLVEEATMAKRLVRARRKIADAHIAYRLPSGAELSDRLPGVLAVVYLIATEAHAPTSGNSVTRIDLEVEALGLARLLAELMPDEAEVLSLLALLAFIAGRRPARVDENGDPVLLADQDRTRWDRDAIAEGSNRLAEAIRRSGGVAGSYQLQAHLASCHSTAPTWSDTDWDRIVGVYDLLWSISANPVVALNRAVAITERDGPTAGLTAIDAITGLLGSHLWHAARAEALRRLDRTGEAHEELARAITLAPTEIERRLLARRLGDPAWQRE
jgi:RNA polymerase sigma factor (sigma-70 family)